MLVIEIPLIMLVSYLFFNRYTLLDKVAALQKQNLNAITRLCNLEADLSRLKKEMRK